MYLVAFSISLDAGKKIIIIQSAFTGKNCTIFRQKVDGFFVCFLAEKGQFGEYKSSYNKPFLCFNAKLYMNCLCILLDVTVVSF